MNKISKANVQTLLDLFAAISAQVSLAQKLISQDKNEDAFMQLSSLQKDLTLLGANLRLLPNE